LPRENESPKDYLRRQAREPGRIEAIMGRNSERSSEYETERDFAMLLIEGYTFARRREFKQLGATPPSDILQGLVAEELKDMRTLAKGNSTVIFTPPVTGNPSK
jgi:molybdopterin converting factor small subunit